MHNGKHWPRIRIGRVNKNMKLSKELSLLMFG